MNGIDWNGVISREEFQYPISLSTTPPFGDDVGWTLSKRLGCQSSTRTITTLTTGDDTQIAPIDWFSTLTLHNYTYLWDASWNAFFITRPKSKWVMIDGSNCSLKSLGRWLSGWWWYMCLGVKSISTAKSLQLDELWQTTMNLLFLMVAIVWSFILERSFVWLISSVCRLLVQVFICLTQYFHDNAIFVIICFAKPMVITLIKKILRYINKFKQLFNPVWRARSLW